MGHRHRNQAALIALRREATKALKKAIALNRPNDVRQDGKIADIGGGPKRNRKTPPKD